MPVLPQAELAIRQRLKNDLPHYADRCLRIRTKSGAIEPFRFNRAQLHIHEQLERQKAEKGFVRAVLLKGRQQGASTYVGARFYHRVTHSVGCRVFILTHEDPATQNLFDMVDRYHQHCPPIVKPITGAANAKELAFTSLDSGYKVGTAGSKGVGRSSTVQLFHGSEVSLWANAAEHAAGVLQAVPRIPGTEIILESTAKGIGNYFHQCWRDAEAGIGDFIAIFVPWFWSDEYRLAIAADFTLDDDEAEYAVLHGLDLEQMAWRRQKIIDLKDPDLFRQEYPATAAEAFQTTGHDSFIKPAQVLRARKAKCEAYGPLVMGVDPSRFGDDRFAIAYRQGRVVPFVLYKSKIDIVAGANWVQQEIDHEKPDRVFIDVGGLGAGIYDILMSRGKPYNRLLVAVNFGSEPQEPVLLLDDGSKKPGPRNRRAEMWMRMRDWLDETGGVDLPDEDALQADMCAPAYGYDIQQRLQLEEKQKIRARGMASPDGADAIALTFAEAVGDTNLVWDQGDGEYLFADESRSGITGY